MGPVFVIGPPRSGTTLIRDLLSLHPDLAVHGEDFHPFHHDLTRFRHRAEPEDHFRFTAAEASPELATAYQREIDRCRGRRPQFVLKISTLSIQVDYVRALVPNARFIQLVRDGRDTVCSMEDLRRALEKQVGTPRDLGPAPDPFGLACAARGDPPHLRAAASWWYHVTRSWLDLRFAGAEAFRRYRYEDLVVEPDRVLDDIQRFIGVEPSPAVAGWLGEISDAPGQPGGLGYSTSQATGACRMGRYHDELDPDLRCLAAPLFELPMRLLGYEPDPWPEVEPFFAAARRLGVDAEQWRDEAKEAAAWFSLHNGVFDPGRLLRASSLGSGAKPLLIEGAVVGGRATHRDGGRHQQLGLVQKQDRRYTFEDPGGWWPALATNLDGRTDLAELEARFGASARSLLQRLVDLGFVAAA